MNVNHAAQPIAIVGLGGVFPGAADLEGYWQGILAARSQAAAVPAARWALPPEAAYAAEKGQADKVYSRNACLVSDFSFDAGGFALPAGLLLRLDPLFHLVLHAAREAWQATRTEGLDRQRVGVILGQIVLPSDAASALAREIVGATFAEAAGTPQGTPPGHTHPLNRYVAGLPGGLVARALDLGGGAYTLDAACASSLYALKLAVDELRAGRLDAVLTGGVSRPDCMYTQMGFSQLRALSANGRCAPFDAAGDGLVVGEGAGVVVLKRLADARRDGDTIHAVIRGIGLSNDIDGSLLAPSSEGQLRAMRAAYAEAGWAPEDVDLIECHATGTPVGDAVEVGSLKTLWGEAGWQTGQCVLGSVKSNIGHLLTAAGAAGLIKLVHALRDQTLPPTAGFSRENPALGLAESPFRVLTAPEPWPERAGRPRRAALSAFGFGGINAHVLIEADAAEAAVAAEAPASGPAPAVAIVGMAARFGGLATLREFQEAVLGGTVAPRHVLTSPTERWWGVEQSDWFARAGHGERPWSGFFLDKLEVPVSAFRIPPRELAEMLPQQVLMLSVAGAALADAGLREGGPTTGVFIGIALDPNTTNFHLRWTVPPEAREHLAASHPALTANRTVGALGGMVASRIAREFRIGGPSFTLSSEETSGLRALEAGVRALQRGELDLALVGAVDLPGDPRAALPRDGHRSQRPTPGATPFTPEATGAVPGEGASALVLKRLDDAIAAGDRIYAVIDGLGAATGGGADGGVPTSQAYTHAMTRAQAEAGITSEAIGLLEAHGSGDPAEDALEAAALAGHFGSSTAPRTALSSVKAVIGHTGAASGLAGVVKAALCLYQEILPPLHGPGGHAPAALAPALSGDQSPFHSARQAQYWWRNRSGGPRRAGVSAIGVDGGCHHVVLSACEDTAEARETVRGRRDFERLQPLGRRAEALFTLSGDTPEALGQALARLAAWGDEQAHDTPVEAIARGWFHDCPADAGERLGLGLVARDRADLLSQVRQAQAALASEPDRALTAGGPLAYNPAPLGAAAEVAFVFPGSGSHYAGMGLELATLFPAVPRRQDAETATLGSQAQPVLFAPWRASWPAGWEAETMATLAQSHQAVLFGQVAHGALVHDVVSGLGVTPGAMIGYSLGETAAFVASRTWHDRDGMAARMADTALFTRELAGPCEAARWTWDLPEGTPVDWVLGVVDRGREAVTAAISGHARVYLLIVNAPQECVVGGDRAAVAALVARLGSAYVPLDGVTTVHCEVAEVVEDAYRALHLQATEAPEGLRFYSGAWGRHYPVTAETAAESVVAQALAGLDFTRVVDQAYADGVRAFVEMGPRNSCSRMIKAILGDRPHLARSACTRGQGDLATLLRLLAHLHAERIAIDLAPLYGTATPAVGLSETAQPAGPMLTVALGGMPFQPLPRRQAAAALATRATEQRPGTPALPAATRPPLAAPRGVAESPPVAVPPVAAPPMAMPPAAATPIGAPPASTPHVALPVQSSAPQPLPSATTLPAALWPLAPLGAMVEAQTAAAEAHAVYLRLAEASAQAQLATLSHQAGLIALLAGGAAPALQVSAPALPVAPSRPVFMDRDACLAYARGEVGPVLGAQFAGADAFPTRVRLPDEPLMLVDRIVEVTGEPLSMSHGTLVTEHDVLPDAWYLDGGRIPTCIAVEAGQADLFLSGWLGIDFETRGLASYRLLDAVVTFHRPLPGPGEVIRYDIAIERFVRQGDTWIFFFNFEATVGGQPLLSMRKGCAGFFTPGQLADGRGIVFTALDSRPAAGKLPADWRPLVPMAYERYTDGQLAALRAGDLGAAFGPAFAKLSLTRPYTLPGGRMQLVDRVLDLEPAGGRCGLGLIRAEADIHPDDWFLTCHFIDDMVMPGTLMYECCMHTLRIFLMRLGWVGEAGAVVFEPLPGVASQLKCRGQVLRETRKVTYEITIKELGYGPEPYAIADALMLADGRPIVLITDMSARASGLSRGGLEALWAGRDPAVAAAPRYDVRPALYSPEQVMAYAVGKPSEAFGTPYTVFDSERIIARLPGPPYLFLDRVTAVTGEPFVLTDGVACEAQYDVPPDAWYFAAEGQPVMPFAVLLEVALQPCGWLACYAGSALTSDEDLSFRNLGGEAVQYEAVTPHSGTLTTRVVMTKVSQSGGMIIQAYTLDVTCEGRPVYRGTTSFGFFTKAALAQQIGVRGVKPSALEAGSALQALPLDLGPWGQPGPGIRMLDAVDTWLPTGGDKGLGFLRGTKRVDPAEWFFAAHFYQDPVCPGSLGLESMLQLLKLAAAARWGAQGQAAEHFEVMALGQAHSWVYRGQIVPSNKLVTVEATITAIDDAGRMLTADGQLSVDGIVIYQMKDFALRVVPGSRS